MTAEKLKEDFERETGLYYQHADGLHYTFWLENKILHLDQQSAVGREGVDENTTKGKLLALLNYIDGSGSSIRDSSLFKECEQYARGYVTPVVESKGVKITADRIKSDYDYHFKECNMNGIEPDDIFEFISKWLSATPVIESKGVGMEWVKASDNLPDRASHYNCEFLGVPTVFWIDKKNESIVNRNGDLIHKSIWDKIKWLSESTPSTSTDAGQLFTREQMIEAVKFNLSDEYSEESVEDMVRDSIIEISGNQILLKYDTGVIDVFKVVNKPVARHLPFAKSISTQPVSEAGPHECPNCNWQCTCSSQPCSCCNLVSEGKEEKNEPLKECMAGRDGECNHPMCPITEEDCNTYHSYNLLL